MTKVIVPSKAFREAVRDIYLRALKGINVRPAQITVHLDSSATVNVKGADLDALLAVPGIVQLSDLSKLGNITVSLPDALDYLRTHNPTEGVGKTRKSANPMTAERKAELERRRQEREYLRAVLADTHGIGEEPEDDEPDDDTL